MPDSRQATIRSRDIYTPIGTRAETITVNGTLLRNEGQEYFQDIPKDGARISQHRENRIKKRTNADTNNSTTVSLINAPTLYTEG